MKQQSKIIEEDVDSPALTEADFKRMRPYRTSLLARIVENKLKTSSQNKQLEKPINKKTDVLATVEI